MNKNYPLYKSEHFKTIKEMLEKQVKNNRDAVAYKYEDGKNVKEVTYGEFYEEVVSLGTALNQKGYQHKHISCIGHNSYRWLLVYMTTLLSNNVFIPIDKDLPQTDIINVINHSEADIVFCDGKYMETLNNAEFSKSVEVISLDDEEKGLLSLVKSGREAFLSGDRGYLEMEQNSPQDMKMILYTSGTTGNAKGVMLSEKNMLACVCSGLEVADVSGIALSVLPYHHSYELVGGILMAVHEGSTVCINKSLKSVTKSLLMYKPTYMMIVPAFAELFYDRIWSNIRKKGKEKAFRALLATSNALLKVGIDKRKRFFGEIHAVFGGKMEKFICGGAPLRPEIAYFFNSIGISLQTGYGITECSPLVTGNRERFDDPKTVGVSLPCNEVRIDKPDDDGIGEIKVKGDSVMLGYYKEPEKTAEVLKDGWFYTGDYGKFTDKRQLIITGRKKNLIVLTNGKNIFPEEIEEYIQAISEVSEVIVFSRRDEDGYQRALTARVYVNPDTPISLEELRIKVSAALSKLPKYKQVQEIIMESEAFEKTTTKKIKRQKYIEN
ncbi:MAG: AMP-binding protein [Clostridia bacterium]|nr:AMP-binding protein [Clostridia bacterium]